MDLLAQFKKSVASIALTAMAALIGLPIAQASLGFTDDAEVPSWAEEAITELMDQGVVAGNDDGSFAPNRQLNRAEVSKIIVLASGVATDTTGGPHFPDVAEDAWYYDYIETMYNYGWVNGYPDGMFRPGVGINRSEIAKMVVNAFEIEQDLTGAPHFDDVLAADWFYGYVETAYNNGLMRGYGDGTFGPANAVTRAETAVIVYNGQLVVATPTGPAEGTLEAKLSDLTPRGTNVPYNATSVPYTTVEFTASDDSDVEVSSVTFTRLGLGDNDDFENVWLEIDGFKVGNDKSVNNDDVVELRFNPPVVVPAGQTIIADIVGSAKYTSTDKNVGHNNRFALVSADDIVSTAANVVGDFPIEGEEMQVADYEVSTVTFTSQGSATTVDVGDNFIEIGKFRLLNASNTNKDVELRAITFKNDGTAELEDNLENVALYVSGEQVSAETIIDGDYVTFRLDNGVTGGYVVEDGDSKIFSIRADIVSAEASDTVAFKIDNYEDVVGVEIGTSFGIKTTTGNTSVTSCVAGGNAEDTCATLSTYTIDSGDLNVSRDPSSLGNQEYSPGSNDVVVLTARLVVDQPLLVDGVYIYMASGSTVTDTSDTDTTADDLTDFNIVFDNFRLYLNDKLVDTENDFEDVVGNDAVTDMRLNFNTTFEIAGTSILKLVANIADSATGGDKIKLQVAASNFLSPEYISTGDQVAPTGMLGSAVGSFLTVQDSALTVTETSGLSDGNKIVAGVDDVTFMKFIADNNDSGDANVTSLTVGVEETLNTASTTKGVSGSARDYTNFTLAVFVDGTQQGSAKNLTSLGKATFNDLSVVVPSAGQKEFTVVVDTIEASATAISGTTTVSTANTSYNAGTTFAGVATIGDVVYITPSVAASAAASAVTAATRVETYVTAINTTSGLITATGTYVASTTTETAGVSTITVNDLGSDGETIVLIDPSLGTAICTITVDLGTTEDNTGTCADGTLTIADSTTYASAAAIVTDIDSSVAATLAGYTVTSSTADLILTETATPFVGGNVLTTGSTFNITNTATTAGVNTGGFAVAAKHMVKIDIEGMEADNVENGQTVSVNADATPSVLATAVEGTLFELITSGTLTVSTETQVPSDILVAGTSNKDVLKARFNAADDEVQITDLYFENDVDADGTADNTAAGSRVDFKMYNEAGQLIQQKTMSSGALHFELANQDRIRVPKDDSTFVTIKVDVRDINRADQTGSRLLAALDADGTEKGIKAVTAATGDDITTPTAGWGDVVGEDFIAYRTNLIVEPAATQPTFTGPSVASQEVYRFTVSADANHQASLERLTMDVALAGMDTAAIMATADFAVYRVSNGTAQTGTSITDSVTAYNGSVTGARVVIDFTNETVSASNPVTYALFIANLTDDGSARSDDDAVSVTFLRDANYDTPTTKALMKAGTTAAPATVNGTDATITVADTAAVTAGVIDADDNAAQTYSEAIGRYAVVTDAVTAANSRLVRITAASSDATNTTFTFTPVVGAATTDADNDTIMLHNVAVWSDESDPSHTASTSDWLNGYEVDVNTANYQNGPY